MRSWLRLGSALSLLALSGCGFLMHRASVSRDFSARFSCQKTSVSRTGSGYQVRGCGRVAEYACSAKPVTRSQTDENYDPDRDPSGAAVAAVVGSLLFAGSGERCSFAYLQGQRPSTPMPIASSAPGPVRRLKPRGELVLKSRVLFQGGYLSARAKPSEYPAHVLFIVHGTARLPDEACRAEIFHEGVPVEILGQQRVSPYEVQLLVPVSALQGAERALRFAGSVCGLDFYLDASGRATLGEFALQFHEELVRTQEWSARAAGTVSSP